MSAEQTFASQAELNQISPVIEVPQVNPVYPEIARQTGLGGNVIVFLWVDKKGKVRDIKIVKSDSEIFNQSVIDAAIQYVFTPAMMKNGPVSVWISVPFLFKLND